MASELLLGNPLLPRAVLTGLGGAAVLMLIYWYGRLGQLMLPAYAVLFAALAIPAHRQPTLPFAQRFSATLLGFCIATGGVYALSMYSAARDRARRLQGAPAEQGDRMDVSGHAMRVGLIIAAGAALSAIVVSTG